MVREMRERNECSQSPWEYDSYTPVPRHDKGLRLLFTSPEVSKRILAPSWNTEIREMNSKFDSLFFSECYWLSGDMGFGMSTKKGFDHNGDT